MADIHRHFLPMADSHNSQHYFIIARPPCKADSIGLTMRNARRGYGTVLGKAAQPQEMQFLSMPLGAGNKAYPYGRVFTTGPVPGIDAGPDGELEFN